MTTLNEISNRASRLVGQVLREKWRLDALIGVGGMAAVYAATHRNGKRVAIKLLHAEMSVDSTSRARFLREGYVANKVGHPGVVSVLDDDTTEDGRAFLVMDLLEGETLKSRWRKARKRLPIGEVLRIARTLLDVLEAAHSKGIVHRDLKPDNVFLTNDGDIKVLDFGIARLLESNASADATRSTSMLGTPAFMAPEQARSRWEWVDARTDLWAVGATMFTMLTGQFVHEAETATEILVMAATARAKPIRQIAPEVPESVAAIIDRALEFDQADRWPDARSMREAISAVVTKGAEAAQAPQSSPNPSGNRMLRPVAFGGTQPIPPVGPKPGDAPASGGGLSSTYYPQAQAQATPSFAGSPTSSAGLTATQHPASQPSPGFAGSPFSSAGLTTTQHPASQPSPGFAGGPAGSAGTATVALDTGRSSSSEVRPSQHPEPQAAAWQTGTTGDQPGSPTFMTMNASTTTMSGAPTTRMRPSGGRFAIAGALGALVVGVITGVILLRSGGGGSDEEGSAASRTDDSAAPSAQPAPSPSVSSMSVEPAPEAPAGSAQETTAPATSASATSKTGKQRRTSAPRPKSGNPLDKY